MMPNRRSGIGCYLLRLISTNNKMLNKVRQIGTRVWQIEALKIKRKGAKNIFIAYFLLFSYFYFVPIIGQAIWPEHVENKLLFQLLATTITHITCTCVFSLIYLPGYLGAKIYKPYEIEPNMKKPWQKDNWNQMKWKTFWNLLMNYGLIFPLYIYVGLIAAGVGMRFEGFPSHFEIIKQIAIIMIADDFIYMWFHRIFHEVPALYKYHKVHHEYESVFSMLGQYAHPVEEILGNLLPGTIVFSVYRVHIFVFLFWQIYKLYNSTEGHSGYEFPWSPTRVIPLLYGASYHDFHHSKNVGNYATSFYLFELIAGTNKVFFDRELDQSRNKIKDK